MSNYEDSLYEIYNQVKIQGIEKDFNKQLDKMNSQSKHKFKTPLELWEYAYGKVTNFKNEI